VEDNGGEDDVGGTIVDVVAFTGSAFLMNQRKNRRMRLSGCLFSVL
jgi:hypothetical protein